MKCILIHGLGQNSSSWNRTSEVMKSSFDVFCPDLTELLYGKEICYSNLYQAFSEYCMKFDEPVNICGLSLGGVLALNYGIENPEKINKTALIGTQYCMPKNLLKFQNAVFRIMSDKMFAQTGFKKNDFINLSKSMMNLDFQNNLKDILFPVFVICGEKDKANRKASVSLNKNLSVSRLCFVRNAGHEVNKDEPEKLGELLSSYFND